MIRIYLTNLGAYNEGELRGDWYEIDESFDLEEALKEIGIGELVDPEDERYGVYEEYFITDYETDIEGLKIGEYTSITDLIEMAKIFEGMENYELEALQAAMEIVEFEEALEYIGNDRYEFYMGMTLEDVAYEYVSDMYGSKENNDFLYRYFDYKAFARDLKIDGFYEGTYGVIRLH